MAYAHDNFFMIPNVGESERGFRLNHFYDEPSPDLFDEQKNEELKLGVRRPRSYSNNFMNIESSTSKKKRRATIALTAKRESILLNTDSKDRGKSVFEKRFSTREDMTAIPSRSRSVSIDGYNLKSAAFQAALRAKNNTKTPNLPPHRGLQ